MRALESIVHPEVARLYAEALEPFRETDRIVVYSVPLLAERGLAEGFDVVVVIVADIDRRIERLMRDRGMTSEQVRAGRPHSSATRSAPALADVLIDNDGELGRLTPQVVRLWNDLAKRAEAAAG